MDTLRHMLHAYKQGQMTEDDLLKEITDKPFEAYSIGKFDHHREARTGIPEVILAEGKSPDAVLEIFLDYQRKGRQLIASRVTPEILAALDPEANGFFHHPSARVAAVRPPSDPVEGRQSVFVLSAGMLDRPVADEAHVMCALLGNPTEQILDVGVAGLNRLASQLERIQRAGIIIVVAGMDGALPSVIGGLVPQPIISVPTSVGYGASFKGVAALLTMLNSCSAGISVMNIDNGFGAAVMATKINLLLQKQG